MPSFVVEHAQRKNDYTDKFGPKVSYTVKLQGQDVPVELSQKPETAAPVQGQSLEGTIEQGTYGPRFKKTFTQGGPSNGGGGKSPEQQKSIVRQHSQEMAILWAATLEKQGRLPADAKVDTFLKEIIDWFQSDAEGTS